MSAIRYTFKVEMKFSGLAGAWTDISADVMERDRIVMERGIMSIGANARTADAGTLRFSLNNSASNLGAVAGYYSPFHASKRSGFDFNIPVRFSMNDGTGSVVQFVGRLGEIDPVPGRRSTQTTKCTAFDPFFNLGRSKFRTGLDIALNKRADELLLLLLALDPDYAQLYTSAFDTGVSTFAYAFDSIRDDATTLREEVQRIVMSEGGWAYMNPAAATPTLVFSSAVSRSVAPTIMVSFGQTQRAMTAPSGVIDQPTKVDVTALPLSISGSGAGSAVILYSLGQTDRLVQPGETVPFFGPYRDPASTSDRVGGKSFQAVTITTDYTMNTAQDGSGTDLTANFVVTSSPKGNGVYWTVKNNGTTAGYITLLQIRGQMVARRATVMSSSNAYDAYAQRTLSFELPYQNQLAEAQARADFEAYFYAEPTVRRLDTITYLANQNSTLSALALTLNTGAMIAVTESQIGLSGSQFCIHGVRHELMQNGILHTTYTLETQEFGRWIDVAYSSGDYSGNGTMTWNAGVTGNPTLAYRIEGDLMRICFDVRNSTVGGVVSTQLRINIPGGQTAALATIKPCQIINNGVYENGRVSVTAGGTQLLISREALGNWSLATGQTSCYGEMIIPIGTASRWTTPTFAAGNFTFSGAGAWTVGSGDVGTYAYRYLDAKTMQLIFSLVTTDVTAPLGTTLRVAIPEGKLSNTAAWAPLHLVDNSTRKTGYMNIAVGGNFVGCRLIDDANWQASAGVTEVHGQIVFEVQ